MSYILVMIIFPNEKWSEQKVASRNKIEGCFWLNAKCQISEVSLKFTHFWGLIKLDAKMYGNQAANVW